MALGELLGSRDIIERRRLAGENWFSQPRDRAIARKRASRVWESLVS